MEDLQHYPLVPKPEILERCRRFGETLAREGFDAALIIQKADLFYLGGTAQQGHLVVGPSASPLLLVRKSFQRAKEDTPLENVEELGSLRHLPERLRAHVGTVPKRMGLELDVLPVNAYRRYERLFPDTELADVSPLLRWQRMVKSDFELERIRGASDILGTLMAAVPGLLEEGCTEEHLSSRLAELASREGHDGYVRMRAWNAEFSAGTVVSGPTGAVPGAFDGPVSGHGLSPAKPGGASRRPIRKGEPVLVDFVASCEGYLSDQTRVFCLGPLPERLARAHGFCLRVLERLCREAVPGRGCEDLHRTAVGMAEEEGWQQSFMGTGRAKVSFVGHGVGLELDDWPVLAPGSKVRLQEGMVVAVEPKIVLPGVGAVGVEDTCLVTASGLEPLTRGERGVVCR